MNRRIRIQRLAPQDRDLWQKLYYRHKAQRQRRRLLALKAIWDGHTLARVSREQKVHRHSLEHWCDLYLHGGFDALLAPERRAVPQALSPQRRKVLHYILLHQAPADYGLGGYQWTGRQTQRLIEQKWGISLGVGRIYPLFHQFGLSHQRAHRDYGPSDPAQRAAFVADLKKKTAELPPEGALVALDEFALQSVPDTHYAWAPKNTAPTVPSDERHRKKLNGFLSVDLQRGTTEVDFRAHSKTSDAVVMIVLLILRYFQRGFHWITVILDHATIHGTAMKAAVAEVLSEIAETHSAWAELKNLHLAYLHTPSYSPKFNPAEYLIHRVRQDALYHLPCTFTLQEKAERVKQHLAQGPPLTPKQMETLLRHIGNFPRSGKPAKTWPKLE